MVFKICILKFGAFFQSLRVNFIPFVYNMRVWELQGVPSARSGLTRYSKPMLNPLNLYTTHFSCRRNFYAYFCNYGAQVRCLRCFLFPFWIQKQCGLQSRFLNWTPGLKIWNRLFQPIYQAGIWLRQLFFLVEPLSSFKLYLRRRHIHKIWIGIPDDDTLLHCKLLSSLISFQPENVWRQCRPDWKRKFLKRANIKRVYFKLIP